MPFVITERCIGTKDASCVEVCPVDCIHPTPEEGGFQDAEMLFIDNEECIDCGACEPACPVEAIFDVDSLPEEHRDAVEKNAAFFAKK
jgi:NAD-dependent dihydropyrimidine dehydrogenase PreA subunit